MIGRFFCWHFLGGFGGIIVSPSEVSLGIFFNIKESLFNNYEILISASFEVFEVRVGCMLLCVYNTFVRSCNEFFILSSIDFRNWHI